MPETIEQKNKARLRMVRNESKLSYLAMSKNQSNNNTQGSNNIGESGSAVTETASSISRAMKGPKYKAPIEAIKLGIRLRKLSEGHAKAPWVVAIAAALVADSIIIIPLAGWLISLSIKAFLFVFMVGRGAGIAQWKTRVMRRALIMLLVDAIPIIGDLLPLTLFSVLYVMRKSAKESEKAKQKAEKIEKEIKRQQKISIDEFDMEEYPEAA